jgi:hypothetical protein
MAACSRSDGAGDQGRQESKAEEINCISRGDRNQALGQKAEETTAMTVSGA